MTNLWHLTAAEVAAIYKARWQIELFFKWVKQHLKIKSFLGTTANAVMTQVWVALCVYLLVPYVKFVLRPPGRLYEIFKRLQVTALEYRALGQVLAWEAKNGSKGAKVETAELVRKTAKAFVRRSRVTILLQLGEL